MNKRCPHCGKDFELSVEVVKAALSYPELHILGILEFGKQSDRYDAIMSTADIAEIIGLGTDQTLRYLLRLERRSKIKRVGERRGWYLPDKGE